MRTGKYPTTAICLIVAGVLAFVGGCGRPEGSINLQVSVNVLVPLKEKTSVKLTVMPLGRKSTAKTGSPQKSAEELLTTQLTRHLATVSGFEIVPYATALGRLPKDRKEADFTWDGIVKGMGVDLVVDGDVRKFSRLADEKGTIELDLTWEIEFVDSNGQKQATAGAILRAEGGHELESVCEMSVRAVVEELKNRRPSSAKTEVILQ